MKGSDRSRQAHLQYWGSPNLAQHLRKQVTVSTTRRKL